MANNEVIIKNGIIEPIAENLTGDELLAFQILKDECNNFLNKIKSIVGGDPRELFYQSHRTSKKTISLLYYRLHRSVENAGLIQMDFERAINKFLEREIYLTFVDEKTGSVIAKDAIQEKKIIEASTRNKGRRNIKDLLDNSYKTADSQISNINNILAEQSKNRIAIYHESLERWNTLTKYEKLDAPGVGHRIYWRFHENQISGAKKVPNKGRIAETYAEAVINNHKEVFWGDQTAPKDFNLVFEKAMESFANLVDLENISAIQKGDVVLDGNNRLQFAIKAGKASTASIGQYVLFADNLLKIEGFFTKQELEQALPMLITKSSQISKKIQELGRVSAEDAISTMITTIQSG